MKKIALIGSAPSSVRLAPYADTSWQIWACSPGTRPHLQRVDVFFEMHGWKPENPCCETNYVKWLGQLGKPVYMVAPVPEIPTSLPYPKEGVLNHSYGTVRYPLTEQVRDAKGQFGEMRLTGEFGERELRFNPNSFGSTLSWMMALAIMQKPDEIGLWGVDMAAQEEWGPQKDGLLELIHIAKSIGIKVVTPHESDLIRPTPLYGYQEYDPFYIKMDTRRQELVARMAACAQTMQRAQGEHAFLSGALDDLLYIMKTWIADSHAISIQYSQPAPIEKPVQPDEVAEKVNIIARLARKLRAWRERSP